MLCTNALRGIRCSAITVDVSEDEMRDCGERSLSSSDETMEVATEMVISSKYGFVMVSDRQPVTFYTFIMPGELTSLRQARYSSIANRSVGNNTTFLQCKPFSKYIIRYGSRIIFTETTAVMHFGYSSFC